MANTSAHNKEQQPYNAYEHLCSALFLSSDSAIVMLTAYFDESYSHPPQPKVYTIAGYVSTDQKWRKFQKEWKEALDDEGISYFHMIDLAHKTGVYKDWSEEKRRGYLQRLHGIIHKHTILDVAVTVDVDAYDEIITQGYRDVFDFGEPHFFAVIACMKQIASWAESISLRTRMLYVFEQGTVHDKAVRAAINTEFTEGLKEHYRASGCAFLDKRDLLPLQAADILAYENMLEVRRRIDPENTRKMRGSCKNLICNSHDLI